MNPEQLLGLDVGLKHTGIARASAGARLAEPLMRVPTEKVVATLINLIKEYNIRTVVVGLPRNLSGDDTKQTTWVRDWVKQVQRKIHMPFYWQDEALTSRIAQAKRLSSKKIQDIDSLAAAIILQDFLDTPEAERAIC